MVLIPDKMQKVRETCLKSFDFVISYYSIYTSFIYLWKLKLHFSKFLKQYMVLKPNLSRKKQTIN